MYTFSDTQSDRLAVLGVCRKDYNQNAYETQEERNKAFQRLEKGAVAQNKQAILELLRERQIPRIEQMRQSIKARLFENGFSEMQTPSIIPKLYLERMFINEEHPLFEQVFWLDSKSCLRPMLAPGLYAVSQKLLNMSVPLPLKIFEIGSCFRKESEGKIHLKEFTMLNLVEWGTPEDEREKRIDELAETVLNAAGITEYSLQEENSAVYGGGLDVLDANGMELASSSAGPHPLDAAWKISCSWVGIGFGLERLISSVENTEGIHRYARSFAFADGASIDVK